MEWGVLPLGQIDARQDAGLAGHPGVDLVVWKNHGVHLHQMKYVEKEVIAAEDVLDGILPDLYIKNKSKASQVTGG